jgi:2-succinyl-6-hydroxy-2,4-cyclohexadiene-1-carboxylate synthase
MDATSIEFHFRQYGDAKQTTVVMLHGFMGAADDWTDEITEPLTEADLSVMAIDLPGHGKTIMRGGIDSYRMDNCAAEIVRWLDDLELPSAHLVGYSMGGRLALYLAVHYPDSIRKVVLESTSPGLRTEIERQRRILEDAALAERILTVPFEQFLREWYAQPLFASMSSSSEKLQTLIARRLNNDPRSLCLSLQGMGTGAQPSWWEKLDQLTTPLLLIVGEKDAKFSAIGCAMAERCPVAQLRVVPDAGHNVHWEQPHLFGSMVRDFLVS